MAQRRGRAAPTHPVERFLLEAFPSARTIGGLEKELHLKRGRIRDSISRLKPGHVPTAATINEIANAAGVPAMVLGMHYLVAAGVQRATPESSTMNQLARVASDLTDDQRLAVIVVMRSMIAARGEH